MSHGEMRDAFQVWHRNGDNFRKVAEVKAGSVLEAVELTQNRESPDDPHEGERWIDQAGVIVAVEGNLRSTVAGDIILTPDGAGFMVSIVEDGTRLGIQPTDAIFHQEMDEWLAEQTESHPEPEWTPAEQTRLFQEWRSDEACRELTGKGVDYSDAPYAVPTGESYAEQRAAAAASAKFHRPPGLEAPGL